MPLESGSSQGAFKRNVSTLMGEVGKSPHVQSRAQALAIAYSKQRSGRAEGGLIDPNIDLMGAARQRGEADPLIQGLQQIHQQRVHAYGSVPNAPDVKGDPAVLIPLGHSRKPPERPQTGLMLPLHGNLREHYATGGLGHLGQSHLGAPQMGAMGRLAGFGTGLISKGIGLGGFKRRQQGGLTDDEDQTGQTLDDDCVHLVQSEVPGRTDRIPMTARAGSYILPADVVSGLGQGNTAAGAKMWADVLKAHMPKGAPKMPPPPGFAAGGVESSAGTDDTDIVVAGGEVVVSPECVAAIGQGDPDEGKKILNDAVLSVRAQVNEHNKNLPGPVQ